MNDESKELELVDSLRAIQLEKLLENRHKTGWSDCSLSWLLGRLKQEVKELEGALICQRPKDAKRECADVANFAAMINANLSKPERTG